MPDNTIERFAGPDRFLSNFYCAKIIWEGRPYPSSEHLYQAMKAVTEEEKEWVRTAPTVREAKFRGQRVRTTVDWDERRIDAMRSALEAKFGQHPDLAAKLDGTGDARLVEGNTWGDIFWGVEMETGRGENHLGELLMELRAARRMPRGKPMTQQEYDAIKTASPVQSFSGTIQAYWQPMHYTPMHYHERGMALRLDGGGMFLFDMSLRADHPPRSCRREHE